MYFSLTVFGISCWPMVFRIHWQEILRIFVAEFQKFLISKCLWRNVDLRKRNGGPEDYKIVGKGGGAWRSYHLVSEYQYQFLDSFWLPQFQVWAFSRLDTRVQNEGLTCWHGPKSPQPDGPIYWANTMSQPKEPTSLSMAWKFCLVNYYVVPQVYLNFLGTDFFHHPVATSKDPSFIVGENAGIPNHPSHV